MPGAFEPGHSSHANFRGSLGPGGVPRPRRAHAASAPEWGRDPGAPPALAMVAPPTDAWSRTARALVAVLEALHPAIAVYSPSGPRVPSGSVVPISGAPPELFDAAESGHSPPARPPAPLTALGTGLGRGGSAPASLRAARVSVDAFLGASGLRSLPDPRLGSAHNGPAGAGSSDDDSIPPSRHRSRRTAASSAFRVCPPWIDTWSTAPECTRYVARGFAPFIVRGRTEF